MQTEIVFNQSTEVKSPIGFEQAQHLNTINTLKAEYKKKKETARHLYGNKRGAWGRMTKADEKRSNKLQSLLITLKNTVLSYNNKYNAQIGI